jgi:predicted membrane channel-forming protein YqfA (hemolysin III family)
MVSTVIWALFESPMEMMPPFRLLQVVLVVTGCVFLTMGVIEYVYRKIFPADRRRDAEKARGEGDVERGIEKGAVLA